MLATTPTGTAMSLKTEIINVEVKNKMVTEQMQGKERVKTGRVSLKSLSGAWGLQVLSGIEWREWQSPYLGLGPMSLKEHVNCQD